MSLLITVGFLTTEDEHGSGNWGMFDQQMALEFIKENIQAFRGDPSRITIMGDGAGSVSVGMHLVSPVSRNKGQLNGKIICEHSNFINLIPSPCAMLDQQH